MSIPPQLRRRIIEAAGNCCEYCRIPQDNRYTQFQIDHIIPIKHGGSNEVDNLCLACLKCNGYKGPNAAALDPVTGDATKLFHPRQQRWDEHFRVNDDAILMGLTSEGRATVDVLRINEPRRVQYRQILLSLGKYPCLPLTDEPLPR